MTTKVTTFWDKQIARAEHLTEESSGAQELLAFYAELLRAQKEIYTSLRSREDWSPSGDLESDLIVVVSTASALLEAVARHGPDALAAEAQALLDSEPDLMIHTLIDYWRSPSDTQFFAKAVLQPYMRLLAETSTRPIGRELAANSEVAASREVVIGRELAYAERNCPFCGGAPQLSFLISKESSSESGNRDLLCATCLSSWEFRRVICANCGEEQPAKLGYFHSPEFNHIRIEACDSCKHYLKGIDLTRSGLAVPLVDEIYGAPLDLWAREHGYRKIELNLIGL